jgi:hypothetical protein
VLTDSDDLVVIVWIALPSDAREASSADDSRAEDPDRFATVTALSAFGGLQAFPKRSLERGARLSGIAFHVKRDVFRDRDWNEAPAKRSPRYSAHGAARTKLNGSSASKSSTVLAFGNSANSRRRYANGSRPLARAVETML